MVIQAGKLVEPADVIVAQFTERILALEQDFIEGIYITGSLALNDFHPEKSDIDFLVLCKTLPDEAMANQLKSIHQEISTRYPKPDLSGLYLSTDSIQSKNICEIKTLSYHEGSMRYANFGMAPVTLTELTTRALTVFGPPAESLPGSVSTDVLHKFLHDNITAYWTNWIKDHSSLVNRGILLLFFPRLTEWCVLGVARQLCTLQTGRIVSKTEAGQYCMEHLPEKYHTIIREALEIRKDQRTYPLVRSYGINLSLRRFTRTIECVNYIITTFKNTYSKITGGMPHKT